MPARDASERRRWTLHACWLGAAALLGNAIALRAGFVLDDRVLLVDNPFVKSWSGLGQLLRHELFVATGEPRFVPYYRPLSGFFNWLSYRLVGDSAPLQHALNLLLHAGVVLLVFRSLAAFGVRLGIAFGATLVFAVHPATAEVVAYLGGRQDMLGWLLGLTAMGLSRRVRTPLAAAALGFGSSLLGSFFHELFLALFVPLALLVGCAESPTAKRDAASLAAGGVLAIAALFALRALLGLMPFEANVSGPLSATRAAAGVWLRLFEVAVAPTDLAVDVTVNLPGWGATLAIVLGSAGCTLTLALGLARRRRALLGPALAGLSLIAASCALHAGVVLKYGIISDRYAYAFLVGSLLVVAATLEAWLPAKLEGASPLVLGVTRWGAVGIAVASIPLTWARGASWKDQESLQLAMINERPADPESWLAEGMLHFSAGDLERAYPKCAAYAKARPDSDKANFCVGSWLLVQRRAAEAVTYLRPYALARPGLAGARRAFLFALLASQRHDEAEKTLAAWLPHFPNAPELLEAQTTLARLRAAQP